MALDAHTTRLMEEYLATRRYWMIAVPDAGWGKRPELPPPPRRLTTVEYWFCVLIAVSVYALAAHFRGFLLDDEYSVVNVVVLILTRIHMLVSLVTKYYSSAPAPASTWTALALLPTSSAPAMSTPPVCYDWEKPAAAILLPRSSGFADSNWRGDEPEGDYKAAKKCFDSLVRDAAWTCDEQEDDYMVAMKCFDSLVRDAARICFVWSYDAIPLTRQSDNDDPPPT